MHPPKSGPMESIRRHRASYGLVYALLALVCGVGEPPAGAQVVNGRSTLPQTLAPWFKPPQEFAGDFGDYRSPLRFADGRMAATPAEWSVRRREILDYWHGAMGAWPDLIERPRWEVLKSERRENFTQQKIRLEIDADRWLDAWYLFPDMTGPRPAALVVYYEPETSIGSQGELRDFAYQLTKRGFVTLSIGSPPVDARHPDTGSATCQPLSYLAYIAANCHTAMARREEVDSARIGIVGHSYGGKWALFAACLHDKFACVAVSDPGIVWDESRPNVNYWEPWYLGREAEKSRLPGAPNAKHPRTGAYQVLYEGGHDLVELHALMAPRLLLVSGGSEDPPERWRALNHLRQVNALLGYENRVAMTNRAGHDPTEESNRVLFDFFEFALAAESPP